MRTLLTLQFTDETKEKIRKYFEDEKAKYITFDHQVEKFIIIPNKPSTKELEQFVKEMNDIISKYGYEIVEVDPNEYKYVDEEDEEF
jgi:hypothetical protein